MLCPSCREHFQYSRKAQREWLRLKRDAIETLQRASASHDVIECLLNDADAFAKDSEGLCPWIRQKLPAVPKEVFETAPEIRIWDSRKGADIADGSRLGCELCARICFMVSYMPMFGASGSNEDHRPQVPSPDNVLSVKVNSWLELHRITLQPKRIGLYFKILLQFEIAYFNIYLQQETTGLPNLSPVGVASDDQTCVQFFNNALSECLKSHPACGRQDKDNWMPSRLIEISPSKRLRLVTRDELQKACPDGRIDYFTLSHIWGQEQFLTLTKQNLVDLVNRIDFSILPQCFQDAVQLTMQLGGRYIWIDSLCIIQDSPEDWVTESGFMHRVYSNSICNIAASNQSSSNPGLFCHRDPAIGAPFTVDCSWSDQLERFTVFVDLFPLVRIHAPLYKRGWVTQEHALSPRTIHMAAFPLWECRQMILSETLPSEDYCLKYRRVNETSKFRPDRKGQDLENYWRGTVQGYSKCGLTKESDKLVALCGIAKALSEPLGQEYYAGIWASSLLSGLLWGVQKFTNGVDMNTTRYTTYIAPSWSWASVNGPVYSFDDIITAPLVDVLSVETQPRNGDHFSQLEGGTLTLGGVMFEFPSLTLLMGDWDSFTQDARSDGWALSLDDCRKHYYESETWFLPLALAPDVLLHKGSDIHGILLQKATESSTTSNFTRVGYAAVSHEGEIAGSGWFIKNWYQQPWGQEHYCTVTIE